VNNDIGNSEGVGPAFRNSKCTAGVVCGRCQDVFLDGVDLGPNIARNQALKENVFMMVICIELRIPLFLVGKPGSSKSLAKTIVADAMQGEAARTHVFRSLKSVCKHWCIICQSLFSTSCVFTDRRLIEH